MFFNADGPSRKTDILLQGVQSESVHLYIYIYTVYIYILALSCTSVAAADPFHHGVQPFTFAQPVPKLVLAYPGSSSPSHEGDLV